MLDLQTDFYLYSMIHTPFQLFHMHIHPKRSIVAKTFVPRLILVELSQYAVKVEFRIFTARSAGETRCLDLLKLYPTLSIAHS